MYTRKECIVYPFFLKTRGFGRPSPPPPSFSLLRRAGGPFGPLRALLGAFGPPFSSRRCQTKRTQFSVKMGPNTIFGFNQLKFRILALQLFKQLIYILLEKSKMADMVPKQVPLIDLGVISLSFNFQLYSSSNSSDIAF